MNRVGVPPLLRANWKIQRLKGKSGTAIKLVQQRQYLCVSGNRSDIVVKIPGILNASVAGLNTFAIVQINAELRRKALLDPLDPGTDLRIREIDDGVAPRFS